MRNHGTGFLRGIASIGSTVAEKSAGIRPRSPCAIGLAVDSECAKTMGAMTIDFWRGLTEYSSDPSVDRGGTWSETKYSTRKMAGQRKCGVTVTRHIPVAGFGMHLFAPHLRPTSLSIILER